MLTNMKRLNAFLVGAAVVIGAQAEVTGTISPQGNSVYCPAYYENLVEVVYNDSISSQGLTATLSIGTEKRTVQVMAEAKYGFTLNLLDALEGISDNTKVTLTVSGVASDATGEAVAPFSVDYLVRQTLPNVSANPAPGILSSKEEEVTVSFTEPVTIGAIDCISGPAANRVSHPVDQVPTGLVSEVNVPIKDEYWEESDDANYWQMTVALRDLAISYDGQSWWIPNAAFNYAYQSQDVAKFLSVDPEPGTMSPWDVYMDGWGVISLEFDNEVDYENCTIKVAYSLADGKVTLNVPNEEIWGDWNFWTKNYSVEFPMPLIEDATEEDLLSITISISGITSGGVSVTVPKLTYTALRSRKVVIAETASVKFTDTVDASDIYVYSANGILVGNITNLSELQNFPRGLYLINGKKIIVR